MHPFVRISALVLAILIIPLTGLLYFSLGNYLSPTSVGIIGGADGPTAIFLAPNSIGILFILTVIAFGVGALMIRSKIKRDHEHAAVDQAKIQSNEQEAGGKGER